MIEQIPIQYLSSIIIILNFIADVVAIIGVVLLVHYNRKRRIKMFKGIDVSHNNGVIDWRKVKESGIDFAMIRAGYGWSANQVDKQWKKQHHERITFRHRLRIHTGFHTRQIYPKRKRKLLCSSKP